MTRPPWRPWRLAFNQAQSLPLDQKLEMFDEAAKWQQQPHRGGPQEKRSLLQPGRDRLGEVVSRR